MEQPADIPDDFDPRWTGATIPFDHWHFHRRLLRRYRIVLQPGEYSAILAAIRKGEALRVELRKGGLAVFAVAVNHAYNRIYVLSDGKRLFTALPQKKRLNQTRARLRQELRQRGAATGDPPAPPQHEARSG